MIVGLSFTWNLGQALDLYLFFVGKIQAKRMKNKQYENKISALDRWMMAE